MTTNTINFQRANPLQTMTGLARSLSLPHEYAPVRLPSFPALERTALMAFNKPLSYDLPSVDSRVMLTRQAAYPLWADQAQPYLSVFQYGISALDVNAQVMQTPYEADSVIKAYSGVCPVTITATGVIPGNREPVFGMDSALGSGPWIYVPKTSTVTALILGSQDFAGATRIKIGYEVWAGPGELDSNYGSTLLTTAGSLATGTYTAPANIWIRPYNFTADTPPTAGAAQIGLTIVVTANMTVTTTITAIPAKIALTAQTELAVVFTPLMYPSEFVYSPIPWQSTRLTAVAALFTNVSQVLNKQGTALCARLNPCTTDIWNATTQELSSVNPAEKQFLGLEHGAYTYCPPSTDLVHFWDYACSYGQHRPTYRLDNDSMVNQIIFNDPGYKMYPCNLAVNLDWHIEFRTVSTLWQVGLSCATLESLHQAQLALVASGFFFNNEDHKVNIRSIIATITKYLGPLAGTIHPIAGAAINGINALVTKNSAPPPTTLATRRSVSRGSTRSRSRSGSRVRIMTKAQRKRANKKNKG